MLRNCKGSLTLDQERGVGSAGLIRAFSRLWNSHPSLRDSRDFARLDSIHTLGIH
jgi:hypothetical protein